MIKTDDLNKDKIIKNGLHMYALTKLTIEESLSTESLKYFAYKVAQERLEANSNIGEFVYNVNLGRSIILKYIIESDMDNQTMKKVVIEINRLFDQFNFHAVSQYTYLKDKQLQEKTMFISENHKDKLAILGQMSSSFVHEFRNPLTSVIGFTKLLKSEHPELNYLDIIDLELNQLKFRITQFLHTSKAELKEDHRENFDISSLFEDILQLTYPSIVDTHVNVQTKIDQPFSITANRDEIKQVLLNIFINSLDALRSNTNKPKNLTVDCHKVENDVVITITNDGPEIPKESLEKIFDPFFTTKELGTGIGLFVCKKIIEKHGGTIECSSNPNATTFTINLPS
ncbi:GHKL domain-containing protein [Bacillus sp. PS06]|nr:GHKL domain-containing protein [Bacillus sp. PS06]